MPEEIRRYGFWMGLCGNRMNLYDDGGWVRYENHTAALDTATKQANDHASECERVLHLEEERHMETLAKLDTQRSEVLREVREALAVAAEKLDTRAEECRHPLLADGARREAKTFRDSVDAALASLEDHQVDDQQGGDADERERESPDDPGARGSAPRRHVTGGASEGSGAPLQASGDPLTKLQMLASSQAGEVGLWVRCPAGTLAVRLQQELRRLHDAIDVAVELSEPEHCTCGDGSARRSLQHDQRCPLYGFPAPSKDHQVDEPEEGLRECFENVGRWLTSHRGDEMIDGSRGHVVAEEIEAALRIYRSEEGNGAEDPIYEAFEIVRGKKGIGPTELRRLRDLLGAALFPPGDSNTDG